ncbi:MAG: hypothetical protein QOI01_4530, partial [Mycobacterium sp.]|nr:hypothetical protein [Mycobacterium sp.]
PMVDYLLKEGFQVRAMVRKDDERAQQLRDKGVEVVFGDLLNFRDVRAALNGVHRAYFNYPVGRDWWRPRSCSPRPPRSRTSS